MAKPAWLGLIILSVLVASMSALWVGLQQDAGETSTTYLFGRRIGYMNRPLPVLDDHLNEIVNSVEFPIVFVRIQERLLLDEDAYDLSIGVVEDTQSLVQIEVRTDRSGDADRIARIVAEEMTKFVLDNQDLSIQTEIEELSDEITRLQSEQSRLIATSGGVPPTATRNRLEQTLAGLLAADETEVVGTLEGQIRQQLIDIAPAANEYRRNAVQIGNLRAQQNTAIVQRTDLLASKDAINQEWYRSITPVERTSNVPVAIAMAFAAGVPAAIVSALLVALMLNVRLRRYDTALAGA